MTTIAYSSGLMATDSKMTEGDFFVTRCEKVFRLKHGHLAGFSGDADARDLRALLDAVRSHNNLPSRAALQELKQEFDVLLALRNERVFYVSCAMQDVSGAMFFAQVIESREHFAAIGNGHQYALGAMADGASAKRAVEIACRYDGCTGPPVRVFKLKEAT